MISELSVDHAALESQGHTGLKPHKGRVDLINRPMKKIALCLAAVVVASVSCGSQDALGDMELRLEAGVVNVIRDGETIAVEDTLDLRPGDVIVSEPRALATFALEGGADARQGEIQGDSRLLIASTTSVEAQEGKVLMRVSDPTSVMVEGVTARSSDGAFRVDRRFGSVRAASYTGSVHLDAPGEIDLRVRRLFQATIVAGDLPNQARPYQLDPRDPWDQVLLENVVDLEGQLAALARGFSGQIGRDRPGLSYFRALADGADVGFVRGYLSRKPSDLLIGFTIAQRTDRPLRRAFKQAFGLFDAGARWGVAAAILEVEPRPLVAELKDLILGTGAVAGRGGGSARFDVAAANAGEAGGGTAPPSSTNTDISNPPAGPSDPRDPSKPREPDDPKDPKDPPECTDDPECTVRELEDELFPDEQPSPSPTSQQ